MKDLLKDSCKKKITTKEGDIITMEKDGEKTTFKNDQDEIISVYTDALSDVTVCNFSLLGEHLEMLHDIVSEEDISMIMIIEMLVEKIKENIMEVSEYIDDNYGTLEVERATAHQGIPSKTMLGIRFTPPQAKL